MMRFVMLIFVLFLSAFDASAAWGTGIEWKYPVDWNKTGLAHYYANGRYDGTYSYYTGVYTPADGSAPYRPEGYPIRKRKCDCSAGCRCDAGLCRCDSGYLCNDNCTCVKPGYNGGLIQREIGGHGGRWLVGEKEVEPKVALEAAGADLPDWSVSCRVIVIDQDEQRLKQIVSALDKPPLQAVTRGMLLRGYQPTHWHLQDLATRVSAFKVDGDPTIYCLSPSDSPLGRGRVLYRQDGYHGPEHLAKHMAGALRRADPNYDPKKDPGPHNPVIVPAPAPTPEPWDFWKFLGGLPDWSYVAASIAAAFMIIRGGK